MGACIIAVIRLAAEGQSLVITINGRPGKNKQSCIRIDEEEIESDKLFF